MTTVYSTPPQPPPLHHQPYSQPPPRPSTPQQGPPIIAGPVRGHSYPAPIMPAQQAHGNPNLHFETPLASIPAGHPLPTQNPNLLPVYPGAIPRQLPPNARRMSYDGSHTSWTPNNSPRGHRRSVSESHVQFEPPPTHDEIHGTHGHSRHQSEDVHEHHHHHHHHDRYKTHGGDSGLERPTLGDSMSMVLGAVKRVLGGKRDT